MTALMHPNTNGRKRPSLGEQINRLDQMLDGLSEGLNEAVADAVKAAVGNAVKEAVQTVLTKVLASNELRNRLLVPTADFASVPPKETPKPLGLRQRLAGWLQRARNVVKAMQLAYVASGQKLAALSGEVRRWTLSQLWAGSECLAYFKLPLAVALTIGVTVGVGVWYGGPVMSSVISGVGGFVTTLAIQAGLWLRKALAPPARLAN